MRLQQPDRRSCGAASLVMARRLVDPRYARLVEDQATFAHEAATLHRRLTSLADVRGGWQVPWPRAIGTPPWAVARDLRLVTGTPYAVHPVRLGRDVWPHLATVAPDRPVAVYVGSRLLRATSCWSPRCTTSAPRPTSRPRGGSSRSRGPAGSPGRSGWPGGTSRGWWSALDDQPSMSRA